MCLFKQIFSSLCEIEFSVNLIVNILIFSFYVSANLTIPIESALTNLLKAI